jgi:hypothetical protein
MNAAMLALVLSGVSGALLAVGAMRLIDGTGRGGDVVLVVGLTVVLFSAADWMLKVELATPEKDSALMKLERAIAFSYLLQIGIVVVMIVLIVFGYEAAINGRYGVVAFDTVLFCINLTLFFWQRILRRRLRALERMNHDPER